MNNAFNEYPYRNYSDLNLDWVIKEIKQFNDAVQNLNDWKVSHEKEYEELKTLYDAIISGNFPPDMDYALIKWMKANANDIISELIKNVFFGLTDAGYFVAYTPESWSDIVFNTSDYDIILKAHPEIGYGHLILSY